MRTSERISRRRFLTTSAGSGLAAATLASPTILGANDRPSLEGAGAIPTDPHVANFLECVRTRKDPNAPVEVGHLAVAGPHLANVALRRQTRAVLDEAATRVST